MKKEIYMFLFVIFIVSFLSTLYINIGFSIIMCAIGGYALGECYGRAKLEG